MNRADGLGGRKMSFHTASRWSQRRVRLEHQHPNQITDGFKDLIALKKRVVGKPQAHNQPVYCGPQFLQGFTAHLARPWYMR